MNDNIELSKDYINTYEKNNWYATFTDRDVILDNTDYQMLERITYDNSLGVISSLKQALYINNYPRFWHGYYVFLRVFLVFLSYPQIRYYHMVFLFMLTGINIILMSKKLGPITALSFLLCMSMGRFFLASYCFSYMVSFVIMLIGIAYLLMKRDSINDSAILTVFLLLGMTENFFDFLTTPLLTLGLPLVVILLLRLKEKAPSAVRILRCLWYDSIFWLAGYAGMWLMKWIIASAVLPLNVFADAYQSIFFRIGGNEQYPINYAGMLRTNMSSITPAGVNWLFFFCGLYFLWMAIFLFCHKYQKNYGITMIFVLLMALPYIWYILLGNHSQIHYIFTYRLQIISLFAYFTSIIYCIEWNEIPIVKLLRRKKYDG